MLATAVAVAYFIFTAGSKAIPTFQLEQDEGRLRDEVQRLKEEYDRLAALRDYLQSDEYIEWVARRELGLVRPGETAIIVLPGPGQVANESQEEGSQAEGEGQPEP